MLFRPRETIRAEPILAGALVLLALPEAFFSAFVFTARPMDVAVALEMSLGAFSPVIVTVSRVMSGREPGLVMVTTFLTVFFDAVGVAGASAMVMAVADIVTGR